MKICMVVHQNYFQDERVRRYAIALLDHGHNVDVICPAHPSHKDNRKSLPVIVRTIPIKHQSGSGALALLFEYVVSFVFYFLMVTIHHLKYQYDVIHVHNMPDFLVFTTLIARLTGAKVILDIHDPMPEFYQSKFKSKENSLPIRLIRYQEKFATGFAHRVIAANDNFRTNLITRGVASEKIITVRNFPDRTIYNREIYPVKDDQDKYVLIYPGTIAPRYGLDVAIHGLEILKDELPQVRLWIIGSETEHKQELRKLASDLGVEERIQFSPVVPSDQVAALIARADAGIYPALPDAHMDIAIPTKVLEFTAMGLVVIASDLTVIRQLLSDELAYLFPAGDPVGFARQVRKAVLDEADRNEKLRHIREAVLPFWDWAIEQRKYIDLLQAVQRPVKP
ncbi:MAG: glycosyltransferase family 4 protein [Anaerolineae bacterium]|nr:glycosyltransferase family 4 protein [Anaerolineae bacterium]